MSELEFPVARPDGLRSSELRLRLEAFESEGLVQKGRRSSTVGTYMRSLREFVRWIDSSRDGLAAMDVQMVEAYLRHLREVKQLAPMSVTIYLRSLKQFCEYLLQFKLIGANPVADIAPDPQPPANSREILTLGEAEKLLKATDARTEKGARDHSLVACTLYGGLNEVQLIQADIKDAELDLWGWHLRMDSSANRGLPRIALDDVAASSIELYLAKRQSRKMSDPLFVSHGRRGNGKRLTTRTIRNCIRAALNSAGITRPGITPSSLKLTAVLLWLLKGHDKAAILDRVTENTLRARLDHYSRLGLLTAETLP